MSNWDDENSGRDSPPPPAALTRNKFGDEEEEDDVADAWDAEDSDEEREKAKKKTEAEEKKKAEAAANKKTKAQRIAEHQSTNAAIKAQLEAEALEEYMQANDPNAARDAEIDADLAASADLLGIAAAGPARRHTGDKGVLVTYKDDLLDLGKLDVFNPAGKPGFDRMRDAVVPLLTAQQKKPHYHMFLQELYRNAAKGLSSEQIKKLASTMTALANERQKEEKAMDKVGKKTKTKVKASLQVNAGSGGAKAAAGGHDTTNYANAIDEYDDFM